MLLSQSQDRALGPYERLKLRLHLAVCDGCSNFLRQIRFLRTAVRRYRDDDGVVLAGDPDIDLDVLDTEGELVGRVVDEGRHGPLAPDDEFTGDETTRDIATEGVPRAAEDAAVHIRDE